MKLFWIGILCLIVASVLLLVLKTPDQSVQPGTSVGTKESDLTPVQNQADASSKGESAVQRQDSTLTGNKSTHHKDVDLKPTTTIAAPRTVTDDAPANTLPELEPELVSDDAKAEEEAPTGDIVMPLDDQGRVILNDRYSIEGEGSVEDPYQIHWPLLMSAVASYKPKNNSDAIPAWLAYLDGSMVEISGFIFLPIIQSETSEILLMLNQWDGCCVGVPPTPYDSVEIILSEPINLSQSSVAYATARGRLQVDPYIKKGWLIGLYVLEEGQLLLPDL